MLKLVMILSIAGLITAFGWFYSNSGQPFEGLRTIKIGENIIDYSNSQLTICYEKFARDAAKKQQCFKGLAKLLLKQFAFKEIVNAFDKRQQGPIRQYDCHNVMHYVVNDVYRRGITLPELYSQCTSTCFGACYHGGIEGYFEEHKLSGADQATIEKAVLTICDIVGTMRGQCQHGLGHALMLITNGDLLRSLSLCDALQTVGEQNNCYEGVFMENLPSSTTSDHPPRFIKPDEPLYPCSILAERYLETCYTFQTSYFIYLAQSDWGKVGSFCELVPENRRNMCFQRIGSALPGYTTDSKKMESICKLFTRGTPEEYCLRGVIDSFIDRYPNEFFSMPEMYAFCNGIEENYKTACYAQIGRKLKLAGLPENIRKASCANIEELVYRNVCESAAK